MLLTKSKNIRDKEKSLSILKKKYAGVQIYGHETAFTLLNSPRFHVPSHSSNLTNKKKQNKKVEIKTALL